MAINSDAISLFADAVREEFARGKTKIIHNLPDHPEYAIMENIDAIGAQDGGKTDYIEGKAKSSTTITSNVFRYLESKRIDTHFQEQLSDTEILVDKCSMIPLECVFRFVTTGSHHRREKYIRNGGQEPDGTILEKPIMEFFYKHDVYVGDKRIADPFMQCKDGVPELDEKGSFILLDPSTGEKIEYTEVYHAGTKEKLTDDEKDNDKKTIVQYAKDIKDKTVDVGQKLKEFYIKEDIEVLDGKIEFGITPDGRLVVADVIDADSCRLRKPSVIEDSSGNRYVGKEFSREEVSAFLEKKYFGPIQEFKDFIGLTESDSAPYIDTLNIMERFITSEPGKYMEVLQDYKQDDGKIDFERFKMGVVGGGEFTGSRAITTMLLQGIARKKALELELNFDMGGILSSNTEGFTFDDAEVLDALRKLRESISKLNDYSEEVQVIRIVEGEGFDKQGYREGEDLGETKNKYDKLAEISSKLLGVCGINGVVDWAKGAVGKIHNAQAIG